MKAIRNEYAEQGVESYYITRGMVYENPHYPFIETLLLQNRERIDYTNILDFCGGGGEVSLAMSKMGYDNFIGCDPFTYELYEKNTQKTCFRYSFEDIMKGNYQFSHSDTPSVFSSIICSFAMHLCPEKMLQPLISRLFSHTTNIIIITPHKRPVLEQIQGVQLLFDDFTLTERGKKVFLKSYVKQLG